MKIGVISSLMALLLVGCGPKPTIKLYPEARKRPPKCLRLRLVPPDEAVRKRLIGAFPFSDDCPVEAILTLGCAECNSAFGAQNKAVSGMGRYFVRLSVRRKNAPLFEYYLDLKRPPKEADGRRALQTMRRRLGLQ